MKKSIDDHSTDRATLEKWAQSMDAAAHKQLSTLAHGLSPISLGLAYADWLAHLSASPGSQSLRMVDAWQSYLRTIEKNVQLTTQPVTADEPDTDARFKDATWSQWPYNVIKNNYKTMEDWWRDAAQIEGMNPHHQHLVKFFTKQSMDALSPSNSAMTNPEVMKEGVDSLGASWLKGWQNFMHDQYLELQKKSNPSSTKVEPLRYQVGKDVAVTPGKVIFRNDLIELIQYSPTTKEVQAEPLLIVPSCIMKYYILDLSPHNSMVRYLVAQGFTVFMISWRNPDGDMRDVGLSDYVNHGVLEALTAVQKNTDSNQVHAMGYCLGGTFLAMAAAWLAKVQSNGDHHYPSLASVTLLAAQVEFSEPGELGVFIDHDQLKSLREEMSRTGYFSGRQMLDSFRFLNSRDLIWSQITQRYLLGKDEVGIDMMSWNSDHTRLPERMHNEYLDHLFLNNALAAGYFRLNDSAVALMDIRSPMMVVGTARVHVSPWHSVYKIHLLCDTDITFVLAAGGHNAGIISEPGHHNRHYQLSHTSKDSGWTAPDGWAHKTPTTEGSWWEAWSAWLEHHSSKKIPARSPSVESTLCDAPGEYVMLRYPD